MSVSDLVIGIVIFGIADVFLFYILCKLIKKYKLIDEQPMEIKE